MDTSLVLWQLIFEVEEHLQNRGLFENRDLKIRRMLYGLSSSPGRFLTWIIQESGHTCEERGTALRTFNTESPEPLIYAARLAYEPGKRGLVVEQQKPVPLVYEEVKLELFRTPDHGSFDTVKAFMRE